MTKDALHRASIFRERLGQYDKAIENKKLYMEAYPEDDRNVGYQFDIASILEKKGDLVASQKAFYSYFSKAPAGASEQSDTQDISMESLQKNLERMSSNTGKVH